MENKLPIRLRAATSDDVNFILNSWLKSYRNSFFAKIIANEVYYTEHHKILEKLLKKCKVIIACQETDPNQIYGYICAETVESFLTVHYIYVKHPFRNMGIGKELLNSFEHNPENASIYTHHTRSADRLAPKFNFLYHPYIMLKDYCTEEVENDNDRE